MRIVCVSDLHAHNVSLPDGDVLVIAGDLTYSGSQHELWAFQRWLAEQETRFRYIVFIAGNHDKKFQIKTKEMHAYIEQLCAAGNVFYLEDSSVVIDGLVFYGSPWTPGYCHMAFQFKSFAESKAHWTQLPQHIDVLVTHAPPRLGKLDIGRKGKPEGDQNLLEAVRERKPKLHVFGHIHPGYGVVEEGGTTFVNAAILDDNYFIANKPIVIELPTSESCNQAA